MRLKVADDFLDSDNSIIAQTFAVNEIGSIEARQGGFSNDFTLPLTAKNKQILGFPENLNSSSLNPYNKVSATLYSRGSPVAYGSLKYQTVQDNKLQCSFFSDNSEWYAAIKDKKLSDLDLSAWDHTWNASNIDGSSLTTPNTDGYIYPLIDYGEFGTQATQTATITQLYPAMFVHTLVTQILFEAGWKIDGELVNHSLYKKMILPFASDKFSSNQAYIDDNCQKVQKAVNQTDNGLPWAVEWEVGTPEIYAPVNGIYNVIFRLDWNTPVSGTYTPVLTKNGASTGTWGISSFYDQTFVFEGMELSNDAADFVTVAITNANLNTLNTGSFIELILTGELAEGSLITMDSAVPNITQTDLIKYVFFIFGVLTQANVLSKTITANFFRSIKGNLISAKDWSNKIDLSKTLEIDYTKLLNKYKNKSVFKYKEDANDNELKAYAVEAARTFGEGQFDLSNDHISGIADIFTAPFAPMINIISFNSEIYIPQIRWLNSAGVKEVNPVPKVALIETGLSVPLLNSAASATFSYGGNVTATMPFCWFVKTTYTTEIDAFLDTLAFDQVSFFNAVGTPLIDRFLEDYEDILDTPKMLKAFLNLTEVDISELDFSIPVYIELYKSYFYISKISNFQGRQQLTECELVQIG
ncbi:MAG: hypothetical protein O2887_10310 [Bacteroidetes bacterium]|nr:hypothetical protein [Bacteroidota bacterium]